LYEAFAERRTCASGRSPRIHPSYRTSKSAEQLQVQLRSSTHTKCFVVSHERNLAHHGSVLRPCRPLFFAPPGGRGERRAHPSCVPSHQRPSRQMRGAHAPSFLHAATRQCRCNTARHKRTGKLMLTSAPRSRPRTLDSRPSPCSCPRVAPHETQLPAFPIHECRAHRQCLSTPPRARSYAISR